MYLIRIKGNIVKKKNACIENETKGKRGKQEKYTDS